MQFPEIHIGTLIKRRLKELGMTKAELGRRIGTSRQNINTLTAKEDMSTSTLKSISRVLDRNFFEEYIDEEKKIPLDWNYDSIQVAGLDVTIKLEEPDMRAFLTWLVHRKAGEN